MAEQDSDSDRLKDLRQKFWYNSRTGEVEQGAQSLSLERVGPFDSFEQAQRAPEILAERAKKWVEEEAEND